MSNRWWCQWELYRCSRCQVVKGLCGWGSQHDIKIQIFTKYIHTDWLPSQWFPAIRSHQSVLVVFTIYCQRNILNSHSCFWSPHAKFHGEYINNSIILFILPETVNLYIWKTKTYSITYINVNNCTCWLVKPDWRDPALATSGSVWGSTVRWLADIGHLAPVRHQRTSCVVLEGNMSG